MHDEEGDTATHAVFILPTAAAARKFSEAAKDAGCGCGIIADNTWHYAKHWKALAEMSETDYFGTKTGSYLPDAFAEADAKLSRAVMFGLNIRMSGEDTDKIIKALEAGAKAALRR